MTPKLALIAKQMERRERAAEPAPETGLGAAIEKLIADEVERRVGEAMQERAKQPACVRDLFRAPEPYTEIPVTPKARPKGPVNSTHHRDGAGKLLWTETIFPDGKSLKTEYVRDAAGVVLTTRTTPGGESPVLPPLDIAYKASSREYQPGTPRKLYGNDPEA